MKPNLTKTYPYTGDYYSYTIVTSADGLVSEKRYTVIPTPVAMALSVNLFGQVRIFSESKMQKNSLLKSIKDKNGELIYEGGVWEIIQTAPNLSAIGTKEDYQYVATLISGDI
jgi:hypothetical protein